MSKRKKHSFTLLEVVISAVLTGLLLSFLWSSYVQWTERNKESQQEMNVVMKKILVEMKLSQVLSHLAPLHQDSYKDIVFFTPSKEESPYPMITFSYDAQVDRDPLFCGSLVGALYVDDMKRLCFASWKNSSMSRAEVILEKISYICWSFFDEEEKSWSTSWSKEKKSYPTMIKLSCKTSDLPEDLVLTFFPLEHTAPILYEENNIRS